jgi:hypothetical protein
LEFGVHLGRTNFTKAVNYQVKKRQQLSISITAKCEYGLFLPKTSYCLFSAVRRRVNCLSHLAGALSKKLHFFLNLLESFMKRKTRWQKRNRREPEMYCTPIPVSPDTTRPTGGSGGGKNSTYDLFQFALAVARRNFECEFKPETFID